MTTLLRKDWESVSSRTNSSSSSPSSLSSDRQQQQLMVAYARSSTGAFDRIPFDIFMQILKILAPKESTKLSAVCKSWKLVVSDNRLWITFFRISTSPGIPYFTPNRTCDWVILFKTIAAVVTESGVTNAVNHAVNI